MQRPGRLLDATLDRRTRCCIRIHQVETRWNHTLQLLFQPERYRRAIKLYLDKLENTLQRMGDGLTVAGGRSKRNVQKGECIATCSSLRKHSTRWCALKEDYWWSYEPVEQHDAGLERLYSTWDFGYKIVIKNWCVCRKWPWTWNRRNTVPEPPGKSGVVENRRKKAVDSLKKEQNNSFWTCIMTACRPKIKNLPCVHQQRKDTNIHSSCICNLDYKQQEECRTNSTVFWKRTRLYKRCKSPLIRQWQRKVPEPANCVCKTCNDFS